MATTTYPSFSSLVKVSSAADVFPDEEVVKPGFVTHRDKSDTCATYLWQIDPIFVLVKRREGVSSPLFKGPKDSTWRLHIDWGDKGTENNQRFLKFTLVFVGNILSQLRFQAGYEIFKGEEDFQIGHIDLDGSEYSLQNTASDGEERTRIEWVHNKDLSNVLETCATPKESLLVGITIKLIKNKAFFDCRPRDVALKNNIPDITGVADLLLIGKDDQNTHIGVHKSYLSSWNTTLRDLMEKVQDVWKLSDYSSQTLKSFVDFLYVGDLNETNVQSHGVELLKLVESLELDNLSPRICDYLSRNMWREGILSVFLAADSRSGVAHYDQLREATVLTIRQNMTPAFQGSETVTFTQEQLATIKARIVDLLLKLPVG